jgi:hypothetical protein
MKTNRCARVLRRIRVILLYLALAGNVVIDVVLIQLIASRVGQITACPSESPEVPVVDISDLMAAAR